jgi:hypothetical protein
MRVRDIIFYTLIFLATVAATAEVVTRELTGKSIVDSSNFSLTLPGSQNCTNTPIPTRPPTDDPQLKAISDYEQACKSSFFNEMMLFTNMPISDEVASSLADKMTARLQKFSQQGMQPVVVVEPDSEWGLVDFNEFGNGLYDSWINTYFARLKANGVTDEQMGTWIPFPEPMQSYWNNSNPDDYAHSVNRYFKIMRSHFPKAKTAILLDIEVTEEQSPQLLAYARLVDNSLVDVVGVQGLPWHPTDEGDKRKAIASAEQFLPAKLIDELAKSLDKKEVLLNTGSYRHKRGEGGVEMAIPTKDREATLSSITHQAKLLRDKGYSVTVNIFTENKLTQKEGVNWSYWQPTEYAKSEHTALFTAFVRELRDNDIAISLYDSR